MKKTLLILILALGAMTAQAQWTVGVKGGMTRTTLDRSNSGRIDETYSALFKGDYGFMAKYSIAPWFAIRTDLSAMTRSYRMDRNLHYLDPVYTEYTNNYLMLPVMADFSFGGDKLRGHAYFGGYGGWWADAKTKGTTYWMTDYYIYFENFDGQREFNSEDQRFIAGAVGGAGLSYVVYEGPELNLGLQLDALYYYDLVSHHKGYAHLSDPRYLNTLSLTLGLFFSF